MAALSLAGVEPTLDELLGDPIFRLIQESDHVRPEDVPYLREIWCADKNDQ